MSHHHRHIEGDNGKKIIRVHYDGAYGVEYTIQDEKGIDMSAFQADPEICKWIRACWESGYPKTMSRRKIIWCCFGIGIFGICMFVSGIFISYPAV